MSSRLTFSSFPQFKYCSQHWFSPTIHYALVRYSSSTFFFQILKNRFHRVNSKNTFQKFNTPRKKNILTINIINFQDQHRTLLYLPSWDVYTHVPRGMKIVCLRKSTLVSRERNYNRTPALLTPKISVFTPVSSTCKWS